MLDLKTLAKHYIPISVAWLNKPAEFLNDMEAIHAVESSQESQSARIERVHRWLQSYHVLQSFTTEYERRIAEQIITYADRRGQKSLNLKQGLILAEYKRLESQLQAVLPPNIKSGKPRKVTSLVSKAMWCCYPYDVPIYDSYVEHALQVICRICSLKVTNVADAAYRKYEHFLDAWFQVFEEIEPIIDPEVLRDYPFKPRVLDSLLWYFGQPKFDEI